MTSESHKELYEQNKDSLELTPQKRRLASRLARTGIAILVASGAVLGVSACSNTEATEPLKPEYKVGDVMLEAGLAQSRQNVRELCNTGEGADEMKQEWKDSGYQEILGMKWIDAFTYMADLKYIDDTAIVDYGAFTYPTIELLSKTCNDAAFLTSQPYGKVAYAETAAPLLDEFHTKDGSNDAISLDIIFNTIEANK
ncbi:MAG TPA: hypothetical protein PLZ58_01145 [Candidatus Saccharibacteria bacterium]|nr:hypothetical protein [Candidatus Saccharibacteria bacterium]HRQ07073.1 hypothetical protein [Candidatus Saccharibacteria bacterium]